MIRGIWLACLAGFLVASPCIAATAMVSGWKKNSPVGVDLFKRDGSDFIGVKAPAQIAGKHEWNLALGLVQIDQVKDIWVLVEDLNVVLCDKPKSELASYGSSGPKQANGYSSGGKC